MYWLKSLILSLSPVISQVYIFFVRHLSSLVTKNSSMPPQTKRSIAAASPSPTPSSEASTTPSVENLEDATGVQIRRGQGSRISVNNKKKKCRVLFSYQPKHEDELKLEMDDVVDFFAEVEDGWWKGKLRERVGVFPSNFVEMIKTTSSPDNEDDQTVADKKKQVKKSPESSNISSHLETVQRDPNALTTFARKSQFNGNPSTLKRGVVEHFDSKKCFGFIKSDLGMKHNIYFHLSKVVNTQGTDVIIQKGSKIRYEVQPDSKDKPRASIVYLDFQSVSQTSGMKGSGGSWLKGEIVDKKECFCFIRPLEPLPRAYPDDKDVYLSLKFISSHSLGLNVGDLVEFRLGARKPEKPEASSFKVLKYKSRDSDELTSFMEEKSKIIKEKPNIAGELLSERGLWLTLSEQANILPEQNSSNRIFPHFVKFFLDFLVTVLGNASVHKQAAKELVKTLSETSFFKPEGGLLKLVEEGLEDTNTICEVLFNMVTVYPEYNAICSTILEAQGNKKYSDVLQSWLIKFYKLALCHNRELNMSTTGKKAIILKNIFTF